MESLSGKITGQDLLAEEFVQPMSEIENVIVDTGQTLSDLDLNQLGKGIAGYVANGNFYTDSGIADAYVLTRIGPKQSAQEYGDGFEAVFIAGNTNTGAATANITGLGVKSIKLSNGSDPLAGDILGRISIVYDSGNDWFELLTPESQSLIIPEDRGVIGGGVIDDTAAWGVWESSTGAKLILPGSYLVSGIVKTYSTPTLVNTADNNHAAGFQALESNITGERNTALGRSALRKNDGVLPLASDNVAIGDDALASNTEGYRSVAVGFKSCFSNQGGLVFGNSLTAVGYETLFNNVEGKDNTAIGYLSMFFNAGGGGNTAVGYRSLWANTGTTDGTPTFAAVDGSFNTTIGYESMLSNTLGNSNTATGWRAMFSNTTGVRNTANGQEALRTNILGNNNVAMGYQALHGGVGDDNVGMGYQALLVNTASTNVAIGKDCLLSNTSGVANTGVGYQALDANITGSFCTAIGRGSLSASTGNNNTGLGYNSGVSITTAISCTALGFSSLLGNSIFSNCTGVGNNSAVTADNQVQLGDSATTTFAYGAVQNRSDSRDKLDVKDLTDAHIAFFMAVEWKQFRMNYRENYVEVLEDGTEMQHDNDESKAGTRYHIGAIAQQVEAAMQLHGVDFAGLQHHSVNGGKDIYSIGYQEFIGIQGAIIQRQQSQIDSIESRLTQAGI